MSLRLDGYVRVSRVGGRGGDSFISPAVQRERIEAWATAHGHRIVVLHEELDESGARADRPKLLAAIARVEAGESDGVIVAKLDRFGRSLVDGLQLIERLQAAGGVFVSVADGFDLTTDTGRLVLRMMLSLAEFELDRVRGSWRDAKAAAVARGIHPSAYPPFGYKRSGPPKRPGGNPTGPLEVDAATGPLVTELFRRRAAGEGYTELGRWLIDEGAVTVWGRTNWSLRAVKDIIRNDVYLGVASAGDLRNPDAHEALTDPVTWRRAQRTGQQFQPRSDDPSPILPLLRCAGCRYKMRSHLERRVNGPDVWRFSCKASATASWSCDEPATILDHGLEEWVVEQLLAASGDLVEKIRTASADLDDVDQAVERARRTFEAWRDDTTIQEELGMETYIAGLGARQDDLNAKLARQTTARALAGTPAVTLISNLREKWPTLSVAEQRELLQSVIQCVFVRRHRSRSEPMTDRLHVVLHDVDVELPARGARGFVARPFSWVDSDQG